VVHPVANSDVVTAAATNPACPLGTTPRTPAPPRRRRHFPRHLPSRRYCSRPQARRILRQLLLAGEVGIVVEAEPLVALDLVRACRRHQQQQHVLRAVRDRPAEQEEGVEELGVCERRILSALACVGWVGSGLVSAVTAGASGEEKGVGGWERGVGERSGRAEQSGEWAVAANGIAACGWVIAHHCKASGEPSSLHVHITACSNPSHPSRRTRPCPQNVLGYSCRPDVGQLVEVPLRCTCRRVVHGSFACSVAV
jgi:hypothetical protein